MSPEIKFLELCPVGDGDRVWANLNQEVKPEGMGGLEGREEA